MPRKQKLSDPVVPGRCEAAGATVLVRCRHMKHGKRRLSLLQTLPITENKYTDRLRSSVAVCTGVEAFASGVEGAENKTRCMTTNHLLYSEACTTPRSHKVLMARERS